VVRDDCYARIRMMAFEGIDLLDCRAKIIATMNNEE